MAILKLSKEELEIIRQDEADFITDNYAKDRTVQRLRPSHHNSVIGNDQETYNYIKDTLDVIIPLANKNGTPITLNLLAAALGYGLSTLERYIRSAHIESLNTAELMWHEKIASLLHDTLTIARADVEAMQLSRKIDSNSAAKAIAKIDAVLDEEMDSSQPTLAVKLVDDLE